MEIQEVLDKIRQVKRVVQTEDIISEDKGSDFPFQRLVEEISEILAVNAYLLNYEGQLLGYLSIFDDINSARTHQMMEEKQLDPNYMKRVQELTVTLTNIPVEDERTIFANEYAANFPNGKTTIIPIIGHGRGLGYLILARKKHAFDAGDMILGEYVATILAIEIENLLHQQEDHQQKNRLMAKKAVASLSFSELAAMRTILKDKTEPSFRFTASRLAEKEGLTRSIIVNGIRKMESANILSSQSLGTKGTFIDLYTEENLHLIQETLDQEER